MFNRHSTVFNSGLTTLYISVLLLSTNGLFARTIALDATSITLVRSAIAATGLCGLLLYRRRGLRLADTRTTLITLLLGLLLGLHWITFFRSMQLSSVAVGIISLFSYPVITVLVEPCFGQRNWAMRDLLAAALVFIGVAIMAGAGHEQQGSVQAGVLWGVVSALLFALRNISQKYWLHHVSSGNLMLYQVCVIVLMLIGFTDWPAIASLNTRNWGLLIVLGLVCTAGAHTLVSMSLKRLPAKSVALISCLQPLLAAIFAWLVLGEIPGLRIIIGGFLVLAVAVYESFYK